MKIRKALGIDLGTTNSVVALLDRTDSVPIVGRDSSGRATLSSLVAGGEHAGRLVVGNAARVLRRGPVPVVSSVKRHMGVESRFELGGAEPLDPVAVSAQVLRHCRDVLAATLGDPRYLLDAAIITMPAYFNHNQIEATRRAGELAGFEVVELLHEPTAAAIYYSWIGNHGDAAYLVYDLGGGTFDASVIRRRHGDYEVLGVSGDPFLGGDDFDRLLASHLQECVRRSHPRAVSFDLNQPDGRQHFLTLVETAERVKIGLSENDCVEVRETDIARDTAGAGVALTTSITRGIFEALIKDKVHRTIDCCREALARARTRAAIRLSDIDAVILVGGSSRIPLVRATVRAAFCNPSLTERVRNPEPLLNEPDLCVAYGAAIRAATHGTRYLFPVQRSETSPAGLLPDLDVEMGEQGLDVELHWTSPVNVRETAYLLTGCVRGPGAAEVRYGGCLRIRCFGTGLTEEVFLASQGTFTVPLELVVEADNAFELIVCDNLGGELVRIPACVRHRTDGERGSPGLGVLPTQLITKPLSIEVLDRTRRRVRQVLAPIGAALPGTFKTVCRTVDQSGCVTLPIMEENRVIKMMKLEGLDRGLPIGSPVEVTFRIDVRHAVEVSVQVRAADRTERVTLEGPPPVRLPTVAEIEEAERKLSELLPRLSGGTRLRIKARSDQVLQELREARHYQDDPQAIQRMAELRYLIDEAETERSRQVEPPWEHFSQMARYARGLAEEAARQSGAEVRPMLDYIRRQEQLAERAFHDRHQSQYHDCWANLERYLYTLRDLCPKSGPSDAEVSPADAAQEEAARLRDFLSQVWKDARQHDRKDLDGKLAQIAKELTGLTRKVKEEPGAARTLVRRWYKELTKIERLVRENRGLEDETATGLLEGAN